MIAVVIAVVIVASAGVGVSLYRSHGSKLSKIYNIEIGEKNGSTVTVNLASVGGYAYVPHLSSGSWVIGSNMDRMISLIPSVTATLYALHSYGDLVGVDQYSTYPAPTKNVSVFSLSTGSVPIESIANLTPDAIITTIGYFSTQDINQMVNVLGIPYIVMDPGNISQIENQNTILGYITGTQNNASLINKWMNVNLQNLSNDLEPLKNQSRISVFYDLGGTGGLYTAGNGTFINSMFNRDHLKNIVNMTGYPKVPTSFVYNSSPQYIILDQYVSPSDMNTSLSQLSAVKNGDYISIANDFFFDEPNFRTVYSIFWLAEQFYPQYVNLNMVVNFNSYTGLNLGQSPSAGVNT